tara:strand:+ start:9026 stop:10723 length:1698 start_codon:yes stop_codon:yes gene_type:complete
LKKKIINDDKRKYSKKIYDGFERAPSRSMLYPLGFKKEDFNKPQVGIASTWSRVTPCNAHIHDLAKKVVDGVEKHQGKGIHFNTITVSDGISMGTSGMNYSLVSREVIADSIETVTEAQGFDGLVTFGGCDKNIPACLMSMIRLNRPSLFVYGGSILPGVLPGNKQIDIVSVFEAVGKFAKNEIDQKELELIESKAIPGFGSCGGMYTANTMASAATALGMTLPESSSNLAESREKFDDCDRAGQAVMNLIEKKLCPKDIITFKSFENAITIVMTLGGSTNAVLHLLALAKEAEIPLTLDDFKRLSHKIPVIADLKPSGRYSFADFIYRGGLPPFMKMLLNKGLLHGDCMTVTGKTLAENLKEVPDLKLDSTLIHPVEKPLKKEGHLVVLYGNLATEGAVAKISGKEGVFFEGKARCFNSEEMAFKAIISGKIKKGHVVVIRYEGPKGGPGMREMLSPTSAIMGRGLGKDVALITDGRFSGGSHGFVVGHITPEAFNGGPLALVEDDDVIVIDVLKGVMNLKVETSVLEERKKAWCVPAEKKVISGVLKKYRRNVSTASEGAITV